MPLILNVCVCVYVENPIIQYQWEEGENWRDFTYDHYNFPTSCSCSICRFGLRTYVLDLLSFMKHDGGTLQQGKCICASTNVCCLLALMATITITLLKEQQSTVELTATEFLLHSCPLKSVCLTPQARTVQSGWRFASVLLLLPLLLGECNSCVQSSCYGTYIFIVILLCAYVQACLVSTSLKWLNTSQTVWEEKK